MRQIIRRRELVPDELRYAGEELPAGTVRVHPLADWLAAADSIAAPAAVLLGPGDEVEPLGRHLEGVCWVVIDFGKIGEGRGYSQARMLRQRLRYAHELRARGAIKRDQLFFLARSGFDAFELDAAENAAAALAAFDTFSVAYQEGSDALVSVRRRSPAL